MLPFRNLHLVAGEAEPEDRLIKGAVEGRPRGALVHLVKGGDDWVLQRDNILMN